MTISICGLNCDQCPEKTGSKCSGCQALEGRVEWGACDIYACAAEKQLLHCGFCDNFPCETMRAKSPHSIELLTEVMKTQATVQSRCGLMCLGCQWKESHGCGGCIETSGHPFHGECHIAQCCQTKGLAHCGECLEMPCAALYQYSILDKTHGDRPAGARLNVLRRWAGLPNAIFQQQ